MQVAFIQALGALLLGGVFVFAGIEHFVKFKAMRDYLASRKLPAPAFLLAAGSAIEIVAGLMLALGFALPFAAGALAVFTLAANVMLLRFWTADEPERQVQGNAFLINFAVIGGLLLAVSETIVFAPA